MGQKMIKKQEVELDLITLKATKIPYSFKEGDTNVHEITLKLDVEEGFEFEKARIHYSNGDYQDIEGLTFIIKNSALETGGRSFEVEFISGAAVRRSGKVEYRVDRSINSEYEAYDKYNELKKLYDAYTDAVDNEVEREQLKVELIELKNNVKSDLESVNSAAQDIADSENDRKQNEVIREQKKIELESLVTDIQSMLDSGAFVGDRGASIEYDWNGTQLGIRRENETAFNYVDLKGERGDTGDFSNLNAEHIETALGFTPVHPDGGITTKRKETVVEYWLDTPEVFTDIDISASDTFFVVIAANNVFVNFVNVNTELNINDTVRIIYDNYSGYDAYINHTVEVDGVYHYSPGNEYRLPSGTGVIDFNFMSLDFGGEITPIAIGTTSGGAGRELAESARQTEFETNETSRQANELIREEAENNRQSTFETNETKRQNEFEENEQGRESAESVRVSNEEERELNEAERITKDSERDSKIEEIERVATKPLKPIHTLKVENEVFSSDEVSVSEGVITINNHNLKVGDKVAFVATATPYNVNEPFDGAMRLNTVYYVVNPSSDSFQISTTQNGESIVFNIDTKGFLWQFEKVNVRSLEVSGLDGTKYRAIFMGSHEGNSLTRRLMSVYTNPGNNGPRYSTGDLQHTITATDINPVHGVIDIYSEMIFEVINRKILIDVNSSFTIIGGTTNNHIEETYKNRIITRTTNPTVGFQDSINLIGIGVRHLFDGSTLEVYEA